MPEPTVFSDLATLSNSAELFNPLFVINRDDGGFLQGIVGRLAAIGLALCAVTLIMRIIHWHTHQMDGTSEENLLSPVLDAVLIGGLLLGYPVLAPLMPQAFSALGRSIIEIASLDATRQLADAYAAMGEENSTEFRFLTARVFETTPPGLISSILAITALLMVWVISWVQPFIYALWYVIGPLFLPLFLFKPFRPFFWNWLKSFVAVCFWSPAGAILVVILVKGNMIRDAYLTGLSGQYIASIAMSLVTVFTLLAIPSVSSHVFGGVVLSLLGGAYAARDSMRVSLASVGSLAKLSFVFRPTVTMPERKRRNLHDSLFRLNK